MSAIWGFISLETDTDKRNKRIEECREKMRLPYEECRIDRFEDTCFDKGFFACGIQYFKSNSKDEVLPLEDEEGWVFTGDIVLNARKQLIDELVQEGSFKAVRDRSRQELEEAPDGTLTYYAWRTWKEAFTDHIQGLFAIAVYNRNNGSFKLFTDHVGCRCIYYCILGKELFFSTLIKPVLKVMNRSDYGLNEEFIAGCESTAVPLMFVDPKLTAFNNVYLVPRANFLSADGMAQAWKSELREYWNPTDWEWLKNKKKYEGYSDADFRELFRKTFFECVRDAADCDGQVAATLSRGLDSSSVVTVASKVLDKGRKIYAYTSAPISQFAGSEGGYYIFDETEGAREVVAGYENIIHSSERCEGISALTEMDRFTHRYELPGKSYNNHIWMDYIAAKAVDNGCKALLTGQFGNYTISNGSIMERFFQELLSGHIGEAKRQLAEYGRCMGISRKNLLRMATDEIMSKLEFVLGFTKSFDEIFDDVYVKKELVSKYKIRERLRRTFKEYGYTAVNSDDKMKAHLFNFNILHTQGLYDTKLGLYAGILLRDPTRDKRMIELCSLLPPKQFTDNGTERRLVRDYLDDCIPDPIRMDVRHRGLQGADTADRLRLYGNDKLKAPLNKKLDEYMHIDNVKKLLSGEISGDNALDVARILALNAFLNEFEKSESL